MYCHEKNVRNGRVPNIGRKSDGGNQKLFNKIRAIHEQNLNVLYDVPKDQMTELEAYALEAAFIDYYGLDNLCNLVEGGIVPNPMKGKHHTEETKAKNRLPGLMARIKQMGYSSLEQYNELRHWLQQDEEYQLLFDSIQSIREQRLSEWENRFKPLERMGMAMAQTEREAYKNERLGIVERNNETKTYVRLCPECKVTITHSRADSLYMSARDKRACNECRKNKLRAYQAQKRIPSFCVL